MLIFAKRVHELRKSEKLTQTELGNLIGVSKVTICGYEKGTRFPSLQHLSALATELNTSVTYLIGEEINVISENSDLRVSEDEYNIIEILKNHPELYERILLNPQNTIKLLSRKIKNS